MEKLLKITVAVLFIVGQLNLPLFSQESAKPLELAKVTDEGLTAQDVYAYLSEQIPIVITAAKHEQKIDEVAASITIITGDEIKSYGYRTLGEVLRGVTGFYVSDDRNYEYLGIRGYYVPGDYSNRVLVLLNGLTMNQPTFGAGFFGSEWGIDLDIIKRIEIVRGPGSALYGTYALFGVINIITKDGKDLEGIKFSGTYGDYKLKEGSIISGKKFNNGLGLSIAGKVSRTPGKDLYFPEFDNITNNNGVFKNGDWNRSHMLLANLTYGNLTMQSGINGRDKGIPTGSFGTIFNDNKSKTIDTNYFIESKYRADIDKTKSIMTRIYTNQDWYYGDYIYWYSDISTGEPYKNSSSEWTKDNWLGSEIQFDWKNSKRNHFTVGTEYQHHYKHHMMVYDQDLREPNDYFIYYDDKRQFSYWSLYLQDIYNPLKNMSFVLGGRYDYYSTFGKTINPRIGWIINPWRKSTLKLLYGSAFRSPSLFEMFFKSSTVVDNPNLKPEKLKTAEVVFEHNLRKNITTSISGYQTNISDVIFGVDVGGGQIQHQNSGKVKANGIEWNLKGIWKGIEGHFGYNHQKTINKVTNKKMINSPANSGNMGLSIPFLKNKFRFASEVIYLGKRLTLKVGEKVPDYFLTNITLYSDKIVPNLELTFKVNNIFNQTYYDPVSADLTQTKIKQDRKKFWARIGYKF